jgi:hypothetical protein
MFCKRATKPTQEKKEILKNAHRTTKDNEKRSNK